MTYDPSRRGQNIIEYLLLVIAVVLVLITGILVQNGVFVKSTNAVLELPGQLLDIYKMNISATSSYAPGPGTGTGGGGNVQCGTHGSHGACVAQTGCVWVTNYNSNCIMYESCRQAATVTCFSQMLPDCCTTGVGAATCPVCGNF